MWHPNFLFETCFNLRRELSSVRRQANRWRKMSTALHENFEINHTKIIIISHIQTNSLVWKVDKAIFEQQTNKPYSIPVSSQTIHERSHLDLTFSLLPCYVVAAKVYSSTVFGVVVLPLFILIGQQAFENKKFVDITQQCFALLPKVNFPTNNLNFHWRWRWWDWIQAVFLNPF